MHYKEFRRKKRDRRDSLIFRKRRKAAAVFLWRGQEIEVKRKIYDKMRDSDVNSSRRQEVCERAVAFICPRLQLLGRATSVA